MLGPPRKKSLKAYLIWVVEAPQLEGVLRIKPCLTTLICILIFGGNPARAQQKGQYMPGQQGLNAGVLPDPGFTYANMTINYSADTLKNAGGSSVPLTGSYDVWAIENIFYYVPKFKYLR